MLGGVQFETGGVGPVPYLNILGGTSQKKHPVDEGGVQRSRGKCQVSSLSCALLYTSFIKDIGPYRGRIGACRIATLRVGSGRKSTGDQFSYTVNLKLIT